ncbi:MAG: tetratricopeptide repeat protein [Planctomycetes bacterium]|nr:tetratricopeptide repeat protein [Planctomycetota bacterium]
MEGEPEFENAAPPRPGRTALRWIAGIVLAAGLLSALTALLVARWHDAQLEAANARVAAATLQYELRDRAGDPRTSAWTGCVPEGLLEHVAAVERRIDAGEFDMELRTRGQLEGAVGRALSIAGAPDRAARRCQSALEALTNAGVNLRERLLSRKFPAVSGSLAEERSAARLDWARALLAAGDLDAALREALLAVEEFEQLEALKTGGLVFLPGLPPSSGARLVAAEAVLALGDLERAQALGVAVLQTEPGLFHTNENSAHSVLAAVAGARGDHETAVMHRRAALETLGRFADEDGEPRARRSFELAQALAAGPQAGWSEAVGLFERSLLARRAGACGDCDGLAQHLAALGRCLAQTGDARGARAALGEATAMRERLFGADDPRTVQVRQEWDQIATLETALEREEAVRRAAVADAPKDEDTHAHVVELNDLARALKAAGKVRESEPYYAQALAMQVRLVGQQGGGDDAGVATLMNNLGLVKAQLGDRKGGRRLLEDALAMRRRLFLDHDMDVVESLINVASWHHADGNFERAFELESEAVALCRQLTPGDDIQLAIAIDNLGATLSDLKRYDEALALHREALAMERRLIEGDDATIAQTLDELGVTLYRVDQNAEALLTLTEALQMRRRLFDADHPDIVRTLLHTAWVQADSGDHSGALHSYRDALERSLRRPHATGEAALDALDGIGDVCAAVGSHATVADHVLAAGRALLALDSASADVRARCKQTLGAFYRSWEAAGPSPERDARAAEWAGLR